MTNNFFCIYFRAHLRSSSGESIVLIRYMVYITLYRLPPSVQVWMELKSSIQTCTLDSQYDLFILGTSVQGWMELKSSIQTCTLDSQYDLCILVTSVQGWMELKSSIQTCTLDGHLHRATYTTYRINLYPANVENIVSS
jgi:hypothetical protein